MSNLYLFNYNNYFNRIEKQEANLEAYGTPIYVLENTNFNYNDGVTTSHVINFNSEQGNYVIITDSENNISSRWFVLDHNKTRGGQYNLSLRRDLVIDFYNSLLTAPMIINRAMITNPDNPLLFNTEGFSFNQIKRNEILLNDKLMSRWYILYFKKGAEKEKQITVNLSTTSYNERIPTPIGTYFPTSGVWAGNTKINEFELRSLCNWDREEATPIEFYNWHFNSNYVNPEKIGANYSDYYHKIWFDRPYSEINNNVRNMLLSNVETLKNTYINESHYINDITEEEFDKYKSYDGKYVIDSNDNLYYVTVQTESEFIDDFIQRGNYPSTRTVYEDMIENSGIEYSDGLGTEALKIYSEYRKIKVNYELITGRPDQLEFTFYPSSTVTTDDNEYNICCLPYETINVYYSNSVDYVRTYTTDPEITQKIIRKLSITYGSNLVDIQLLPYCPYQNAISNNDRLELHDDYLYSNQYQNIMNLDEQQQEHWYSCILYLNKSNFTFNINKEINLSNYADNAALNKKISNEVELWRLVSPNYDGQFEFSLAKNNGVNYFNVDMTLRPFNPYIHINPNFKSLYGEDFDDSRGLILNGDFSLPRETTEWAEYELRNKNYQLAFNRQINHLDFTQNQEKILSAINLFGGTLQGGLSGAVGGAMAGGGVPGAIAGGIVGTVGAAATGIADYAMLKSRQREDKDFTIDNWTYQLGNIKALPNNISKVNPITYNNKKFPFIEKYVATEEEINILKNKITYNSMNVNAYGTIQQYLQLERTFIQGTIIRLEDNEINNHELYELNNELMKGVYI